MSSSRVIDDVIQRNKAKLFSKVKLDPEIVRCLDLFPNMISKEAEKQEKSFGCMVRFMKVEVILTAIDQNSS